MPTRFDHEFIEDQKKNPLKYQTLYQQNPTLAEGNIVQRANLSRALKIESDARNHSLLVITCDFTFGANKLKSSDQSCINIYGKTDRNIHLLDELRGDWDILGQISAIEAVNSIYGNHPGLLGIYVEEKANGQASLDLLKNKIARLQGFKPSVFGFSADKIDRLNAVLYVLEERRFFIPNEELEKTTLPWVKEWCDEVCGFPRWETDDRVDCLTMAIKLLEAASASRSIKPAYMNVPKSDLTYQDRLSIEERLKLKRQSVGTFSNYLAGNSTRGDVRGLFN